MLLLGNTVNDKTHFCNSIFLCAIIASIADIQCIKGQYTVGYEHMSNGNFFSCRLVVIINDYDLVRETFVGKGLACAGRPDVPLLQSTYNPHYPHTKGKKRSVYCLL